MIVLKIQGGIGNQMYGYGMYKKLESLGRSVKMDLSFYNNNQDFPYVLEKMFAIKPIHANRRDKISVLGLGPVIARRLGLKHHPKRMISVDPRDQYDLSVFELDNVYLDGYWSSFDYYIGIEEKLRKDFTFIQPLNIQNASLAQRIENSDSVSIHVRRGDYTKYPELYELLSVEYYKRAIDAVSAKARNPSFYCFSNDIGWCQANFPSLNIEYVDWNQSAPHVDMQLMSLCKHNIVANSTFSIWAAWLNKNTEKIVIRPEHYFRDPTYKTDRLWPKEWSMVSN